MRFELLIDRGVVSLVNSFPSAKRRRFWELFDKIQEFPANYSEFKIRDPRGRLLDVCEFEGAEIRYWIDHADRDVKILELVLNE